MGGGGVERSKGHVVVCVCVCVVFVCVVCVCVFCVCVRAYACLATPHNSSDLHSHVLLLWRTSRLHLQEQTHRHGNHTRGSCHCVLEHPSGSPHWQPAGSFSSAGGGA